MQMTLSSYHKRDSGMKIGNEKDSGSRFVAECDYRRGIMLIIMLFLRLRLYKNAINNLLKISGLLPTTSF